MTVSAPSATSQARTERRTTGSATVSSASTATMTPRACPDGNEVDGAVTNAVAGRGRLAAYLAISVTIPAGSTLITRNMAMRTLRRTNAKMITIRVTRRNAVGPSTVQKVFHALTRPGLSTA